MRQRQKPKAPSPRAGQRVVTPPAEVPRAATPKANTPQQPVDNFVDLADWLREERGPRSYRMVAEEDRNRAEGEEADFTDMLEKFKAGVAANVDDEDFDSHYDLGIAYKEMGLVDEAVGEFEIALRHGTGQRKADCLLMLGMCELERGRPADAVKRLQDGLALPNLAPEARRAVQFELGAAHEAAGSVRLALEQYQLVAREDSTFRDVVARIRRLGGNVLPPDGPPPDGPAPRSAPGARGVSSKPAMAKAPPPSKPPPDGGSQSGAPRNRKIGFI